jgi:glyoxylase-like metal-dependent hydrolase (beta-lactamase superfamily II)
MTQPIRIELPTEFAVGTVNAYLFMEPEPILVDTGVKSDESWTVLQTALAGQNLTVADLSRVIITHPHVDHFGQAARIAAHSEAEIWVADLGLLWVLDFPAMWQKRLNYYRDLFLKRVGMSPQTIETTIGYFAAVGDSCDPVAAERVVTFAVDDTLSMGGRAWQVLHTPGHASMQTCFYQPQTRQFLSADMLLPKAPAPIVERPRGDDGQRVPALPQFLRSLTLVESLDINTVYPGHGDPFGDHRQLIQRQRQRIERRKKECLHLIENGTHTAVDLTDAMYAHRPPRLRFAGLWMLIGYLDLLKMDGLIEQREVDGVWYYHNRL